jgi:hypothetical protein
MLQSSAAAPPSRGHDLGPANDTEGGPGFEGMIGHSAVMREVYELTRRVAATNATVLLTGEPALERNWSRGPSTDSAPGRPALSFASTAAP